MKYVTAFSDKTLHTKDIMEKAERASIERSKPKLQELFKRTFAGSALVLSSVMSPAVFHETVKESQYPIHRNIVATVFWVGEDASEENDYIHNRSSAWTADWVQSYGGIDDPENRCGHQPCSFEPKENPFYIALPFGDYNEKGPKNNLDKVPWHDSPLQRGESLLKNTWVKITKDKKTAYAQWEDVGPFKENDAAYVFGGKSPKDSRAGIDLSPATADYLEIDGKSKVSWQFMDAGAVPEGPWKQTITTSPPSY